MASGKREEKERQRERGREKRKIEELINFYTRHGILYIQHEHAHKSFC